MIWVIIPPESMTAYRKQRTFSKLWYSVVLWIALSCFGRAIWQRQIIKLSVVCLYNKILLDNNNIDGCNLYFVLQLILKLFVLLILIYSYTPIQNYCWVFLRYLKRRYLNENKVNSTWFTHKSSFFLSNYNFIIR